MKENMITICDFPSPISCLLSVYSLPPSLLFTWSLPSPVFFVITSRLLSFLLLLPFSCHYSSFFNYLFSSHVVSSVSNSLFCDLLRLSFLLFLLMPSPSLPLFVLLLFFLFFHLLFLPSSPSPFPFPSLFPFSFSLPFTLPLLLPPSLHSSPSPSPLPFTLPLLHPLFPSHSSSPTS